jgi:hypothetical protein
MKWLAVKIVWKFGRSYPNPEVQHTQIISLCVWPYSIIPGMVIF